MIEGRPSATSQRVAAYRLDFERAAARHGNPQADVRLAADVVAGMDGFAPDAAMARYLKARTGFFDSTVLDALERGNRQVLVLGAGYDGRAMRYGRPGVTWFEVDHPDTQADKKRRIERLRIDTIGIVFVPHDLGRPGLAGELIDHGFDPARPALMVCEGVAVYLTPDVLLGALAEARALATVGTRLALSLSPRRDAERQARFDARVAALGEPALGHRTRDEDHALQLLDQAGWQPVNMSERVGFVVAAPRDRTTAGPLSEAGASGKRRRGTRADGPRGGPGSSPRSSR